MRWLSRTVDELIAEELIAKDMAVGDKPKKREPIVHDAVVVGSGYGGAVSALRLAEKGVKVLVLERGEEWTSKEFPNDIGNAFGELRVDRSTAPNITGNESGLYDFRAGEGMGALVGNGLGGTSLINANVAMVPDARIFEKRIGQKNDPAARAAWPIGLQLKNGSLQRTMAKAYVLAKRGLGAEKFSTINVLGPPDSNGMLLPHRVEPQKLIRLRELATVISKSASAKLKVSFEPAWLTVALTAPAADTLRPRRLNRCVGCGECVSGCNENAKKSLDATYLPKAFEAGARLFTGVTVLSVERAKTALPLKESHWVVRFTRTEARKKMRDGIPIPTHELHARHVILSAGTFGSTEILMRSQTPELAFSPQLGKRLSSNGDALAFGYLLDKSVHGVGMGSKRKPGTLAGIGPTITSSITVRHETDVEKGVLIQEGAMPGAIAGLFHEMISASATLAQLDDWNFRNALQAKAKVSDRTDWAVLQSRGLEHTQTLLAMGHDKSCGEIRYDPAKDRVVPIYKSKESEATYQEQEKYLKQIAEQGAIYIQNPVLSPLPEKLSSMLDAPLPGNATFTVHPLGGCCMADSVANGVVNEHGKVFNPCGYPNEAEFYDGLYVLDGAIVPTSLGANPLLTITALAERAMAALAPKIASETYDRVVAQTPPRHPPAGTPGAAPYWPHTPEVKVHFTEAMRGELIFHGGKKHQAHLLLHLPIDDMAMFWADGAHQIVIPNQLGTAPGDRERLPARLRLDQEDEDGKVRSTRSLMVASGVVSILPVASPRLLTRLSRWMRTMLTWFLERGRDELLRFATDPLTQTKTDKPGRTVLQKLVGLFQKLVAFVKLSRHASECRVMAYRLNLVDDYSDGNEPYRSYTLLGTKQLGYPATWGALGRKAFCLDAYLDRPNVWLAFGEMKVKIADAGGHPVARGTLNLDLLDMTRMHAPQLGLQRNTPNALLTLAGYPFWFARLMAKTRLWDFRLPDYPTKLPIEFDPNQGPVPRADSDPTTPWPVLLPPLRVFQGTQAVKTDEVHAENTVRFAVPRSRTSNEGIELSLTRYKQAKPAILKHSKTGAVQVKAMLMLNGFAQSTLGFVPREHKRRRPNCFQRWVGLADEPGLAEFFYEQGFDVWLFDYRTSSILDASKQACTMDDIAEFDIPAAVNLVHELLRRELKLEADVPLQIYAFAHCVGAASLAMSLLGGYLEHEKKNPADDTELPIGKLAGVTFSQMQAFLVGSKTSQLRLQVGGLLRDTLGIEYLRLSAAERQATPFESLLDRLFASLPVDDGEHCPHENGRWISRPGICTCKRMSGTISRLLKHDRIKEETHDQLPIYFGRANTSLLVHGGRCVENERLVNADGQNVYVTDDNIARYLRLPVAILHGKHNALFDVESAYRTYEQLCRINPDLVASDDDTSRAYDQIIAEDYAHFDCTIGFGPEMQAQILEPLRTFYDKAWALGGSMAVPPTPATPATEVRSEAKAPLAGPVMGWSRIVQRDDKPCRMLRLWIEVDETEADSAKYAVTVLRHRSTVPRNSGQFVRAQLWPISRVPLAAMPGIEPRDLNNPPLNANDARVTVALADLEFELAESPENFDVQMFSVHEFTYTPSGKPSGKPSGQTSAASKGPAKKPLIARPITPDELVAAGRPGRPPGVGSTPLGGRIDLAITPRRVAAAIPLTFTGAIPAFHGSDEIETAPGFPRRGPAYVEQIQELRSEDNHAISEEDATTLWKTLMKKDDLCRAEALRGKPATPSRKTRHLPPRHAYPYTARISAPLLKLPNDWKGLRFLAACCRHPGLAFEDMRADASFDCIDELLKSDVQGHRDFMFMLGDQIYADASAGLLDSPSPIEKIAMRNRRAFSTRGFSEVTSQLPTYMVIDDHEIGDNWSLDDLDSSKPEIKDAADRLYAAGRASFAAYQWAHSPRTTNAPGFNYRFSEAEIPFFVLDTRTQRRRFNGVPAICSSAQLQELNGWLASLGPADTKPKFIVTGSVLAPGLYRWQLPAGLDSPMAESWQMSADQRAEVLRMVALHKVKNVVFLSGDYHCDATARLTFKCGIHAYAIVTPPLYAPLPGANAKASDVLEDESIALGDGNHVSIQVQSHEGSGFADIHVSQLPGDRWKLGVDFYRLRLEAKSPRYMLQTQEFLLS